ncbi:DUF5682 family protein, partial [Streptomyces sp. NPDC040724]|uniref:DUF5682 family protein n=1 Tax=Streptomyces sp. NPDC040724 TaxID=3155612 RepID=UPI003401AA5D
TETLEAVRAVMCDGSDIPLALIEDRLVVGDDRTRLVAHQWRARTCFVWTHHSEHP